MQLHLSLPEIDIVLITKLAQFKKCFARDIVQDALLLYYEKYNNDVKLVAMENPNGRHSEMQRRRVQDQTAVQKV